MIPHQEEITNERGIESTRSLQRQKRAESPGNQAVPRRLRSRTLEFRSWFSLDLCDRLGSQRAKSRAKCSTYQAARFSNRARGVVAARCVESIPLGGRVSASYPSSESDCPSGEDPWTAEIPLGRGKLLCDRN